MRSIVWLRRNAYGQQRQSANTRLQHAWLNSFASRLRAYSTAANCSSLHFVTTETNMSLGDERYLKWIWLRLAAPSRTCGSLHAPKGLAWDGSPYSTLWNWLSYLRCRTALNPLLSYALVMSTAFTENPCWLKLAGNQLNH